MTALPSRAQPSMVAVMIRSIRGRKALIASRVRMPCSITSLRMWCSSPSSSASDLRKICSTETGSVLPRSMRGSVLNWWKASAPDTTTKFTPNRRVLKIGPYLSKWSS